MLPIKQPLWLFLARFLTVTLMLDFGVIPPAFALRQAGLEENSAKQEFLNRIGVVSATPTISPGTLTGMEERERLPARPPDAPRTVRGELGAPVARGPFLSFSPSPARLPARPPGARGLFLAVVLRWFPAGE